jgi:hypothetical protein
MVLEYFHPASCNIFLCKHLYCVTNFAEYFRKGEIKMLNKVKSAWGGKTMILFVMVLIFMAAFSDGCQENKDIDSKKYVATSLYLKKVQGEFGYYGGWRSGYCRYKVFEDMHRRSVIDTICIYCQEVDSASFACLNETDFRFVWDQEYHPEDTSMTWKPMYIERIRDDGFFECRQCPPSKQKYVRTTYGYIW